MAKKGLPTNETPGVPAPVLPKAEKPSALIDTRVVYCGDDLEQLANLPDHCIDLVYIDPPFNSNRPLKLFGEVFWDERKKSEPSKTNAPLHVSVNELNFWYFLAMGAAYGSLLAI